MSVPASSFQSSFLRYRAAFVLVVALLALVAGTSLWNELHTNVRIDELFGEALEREQLIGRIRADALDLQDKVNDHIQASTDELRQEADARMEEVLADAREARMEYTRGLPEGEKEVWRRFDETARQLAQSARVALKFSNRKELERARQHLEAELRPISTKLDALAAELSAKNAEETRRLLHQRENLRTKTTLLGTLVAAASMIIALLVGTSVVRILRRQERTIAAQLEELDRRNRELDAFASRVAHDLVGPLNPLKGYLTLLARSPAIADPDVREMVVEAEASATRMAELVGALLRFCRSGTRSEAPGAELDTAVATILLELDQVAAMQEVKLERRLQSRVRVEVPASLLQSIARNLVSNAVKYSAGRPGAQVVVRVLAEGNDAVLEVTDNGPGMSGGTLRRLFQPFFRAPEARGLPGHGLGLATTKRLVEAHGGTIHVQSTPGAGTVMTVRLPLSPARAPEAELPAPVRTPALAER
ncbi:MAG TPA: ATP-binding protein [Myxococcaceae bacterium]|nr:ATP-binding protein [Myxococcaceae bacterium]